jgi:acyl carrier protein
MNDQAHQARLSTIFAEILECPDFRFDPSIAMGDIETWDSFNHINLMLAIEAEFGVEFDSDQIGTLLSAGQISDALEQRLGTAGQ